MMADGSYRNKVSHGNKARFLCISFTTVLSAGYKS
jgi:hypothetical protein